jgi:hypothetical protein
MSDPIYPTPQCALHTKTLTDLADAMKTLSGKVEEIHSRLFVGNGQPPISVRLDRIEREHQQAEKHRGVMWTAVVGVVVSLAAKIVVDWVNKPHALPHP